MITIDIDPHSGCCFGVARAIRMAEEELQKGGTLYCLGDIVHNNIEVARLEKMGLVTIDHDRFRRLKNVKVLLRAHGEPPETYEIAQKNHIEIIDASCPVVLKLQKHIKEESDRQEEDGGQIVIFGKKGHAEVNGLLGQTGGKAVVIENREESGKLDFSRKITLFSQTTKSLEGFHEIQQMIASKMRPGIAFQYHDTICRQVSGRISDIRRFAREHDLIFFLAGEKSSNGKILFAECKKHNSRSYLIHTPPEIIQELIHTPQETALPLLTENLKIGICGATSTPRWQMEAVADKLKKRIGEFLPETLNKMYDKDNCKEEKLNDTEPQTYR